MKQLILITFLLIIFFSCKTTNAGYVENNNFKRICDIEVESIPTLQFAHKEEDITEKTIKENKLFEPFTILKIYNNQNTKDKDKDQNYYYELSKHYNKDIDGNRLNDKENKYIFHKTKNDFLRMVAAEITFNSDLIFNAVKFVEPIENENTKKYKEKANLFKIKHNNVLIDIGMKKEEFAETFNLDFKKICDTINVHNDTDVSWYLFKQNILDKVIIENYID